MASAFCTERNCTALCTDNICMCLFLIFFPLTPSPSKAAHHTHFPASCSVCWDLPEASIFCSSSGAAQIPLRKLQPLGWLAGKKRQAYRAVSPRVSQSPISIWGSCTPWSVVTLISHSSVSAFLPLVGSQSKSSLCPVFYIRIVIWGVI